MIVVDVNVIMHLYRPGEHTAAAVELMRREPDWRAPVLWRSEFRNALVTQVRTRRLSLEQAIRVQEEAEDLMSGAEYDVDSHSVLNQAEDSGCSAYDCEYVALAKRLGIRLVTRDEQILRAFPEVAVPL